MRVIVFGGRDMRNAKAIYARLAMLENKDAVYYNSLVATPGLASAIGAAPLRVETFTVVHGDARGADTVADVCARLLDFAVEPHPAEWRPGGVYDPQAGHRRNQEMVDAGADFAIGYWDGRSRGTKSMIQKVLVAEMTLEVHTYDGVPFGGYRELL